MKKPTKVALLSALVIPGAGHIYLKKYLMACILIVVSLTAFSILVSIAIEKTLVIKDIILRGDIPLNVAAITDLVSKQISDAELSSSNWATSLFVIMWIIGVLDSYRVAKKQEIVDKD